MDQPKWMGKKPRPRYEREEREFAKDNALRPTISSGRFGVHKGDSETPRNGTPEGFRFTIDNKGTKHHGYTIDVRYWLALRKRSELVGRTPALAVTFYLGSGDTITRGIRMGQTRTSHRTEEVVVVTRSTWEAMRDAVYDRENKRRRNSNDRKSQTKSSRTS